jgi:3-oxoacyl-[acyl-carrier protein] reductase
MNNLSGKTAFITGGSKGIGYGIAEALLREGVNVAITARTDQSVQEAIQTLKEIGKGEILGIVADVKNFDSQKQAIDKVVAKWGKIDLLVANAGIGYFASVEDLSIDQWNDTIETNLSGVFYTLKAGLDALKASKGYFITISSLAGTNFFAGGSAYNASKFGVTGFSQAVMLDLRNYGIRVTTIMPGSVATYFNNHVPNENDAWKIQIEDIGQIVVNLMQLNTRTLPSKIEVRPSQTPS